jgi:hypothetical protein
LAFFHRPLLPLFLSISGFAEISITKKGSLSEQNSTSYNFFRIQPGENKTDIVEIKNLDSKDSIIDIQTS